MIQDDLRELLKHGGKPSVSVIVPTFRKGADRQQNETIVKKAIGEADEQLRVYDDSVRKELLGKMTKVAKSIDYNHVKDGIGIFVSSKIGKVVHFPFPVEEKVIVGEKFEIRDLVFAINRLTNYYVLSLSTNTSMLYKAEGDKLGEIDDQNFPLPFEDEYEHEPTSKPYDKDVSSIEKQRLKTYFRSVDEAFNEYMAKEPMPVVVAGVKQYLSLYDKVSKHESRIVGTVEGNYNKGKLNELAKKAWKEVQAHNEKERAKLLYEIGEEAYSERYVKGIENIMKELDRIRGGTLVVEKNFKVPAHLSSKLFTVQLNGGQQKFTKALGDAVDSLIEEVLNRQGKVVFVDNGKLEDYNHIVLKKPQY